MTTQANSAASAADAMIANAKTVADDMDSRRIFTTTEDAAAYLNHCSETYTDFSEIPLAAVGLDAEGDFDPAVYGDGMHVMVATLSKAKKGVKAIIVAPIPSLDMILADPAAKAWLVDKVLNKELNHVAVRPLREAEDVSTVLDQMPSTLSAYISTARESSGIMETYNELYKGLNETLSKQIAVWAKARLVKSDFKRCLESAGYAREYYPALEVRGEGKDSLFVVALQFGIKVAKARGLDATIFERWAETRDAKTFTPGNTEDEEDFDDIDALTDALMEKQAEPVAAATPTEQKPAEDVNANTGNVAKDEEKKEPDTGAAE